MPCLLSFSQLPSYFLPSGHWNSPVPCFLSMQKSPNHSHRRKSARLPTWACPSRERDHPSTFPRKSSRYSSYKFQIRSFCPICHFPTYVDKPARVDVALIVKQRSAPAFGPFDEFALVTDGFAQISRQWLVNLPFREQISGEFYRWWSALSPAPQTRSSSRSRVAVCLGWFHLHKSCASPKSRFFWFSESPCGADLPTQGCWVFAGCAVEWILR